MKEYLGEIEVDIAQTKFKDYTPLDWTMYFIEKFGQYDGGHHKQWVMDQIVRILKGTRVVINEASWSDGKKEYRVHLAEPSAEYLQWVVDMKDGEDGPNTYDYDEGIAP